jgi:mannose-6-phosphate isomerase-like protein (cupin superfamily)
VRSPRPWGAELLWARTGDYAAKILEITPGHRTSLQHHARKTETLLVLEGELVAEVERGGRLERRVLGPGQSLHLPPGTKHRLGAPGGARLVEVSTPELEDVVRHEDDYGRVSAFQEEDLEIVDGV